MSLILDRVYEIITTIRIRANEEELDTLEAIELIEQEISEYEQENYL